MSQEPLHEDQAESLSFDEAAGVLNVSVASIKNWVKTGYLVASGRNRIARQSLAVFREQVAGSGKLVARANKSQKEGVELPGLVRHMEEMADNASCDGDLLGSHYESLLSDAHRNREGIYFTPPVIVQRFFANLPEDCSALTFCDPCCGSGNFLVTALERGFLPENIHGYDTDPVAVKIARRRLRDLTGMDGATVVCQDFLADRERGDAICYDVIMTNPPWGKKLPKTQKDELAQLLGAGASKDTSSLFFFKCLLHLKEQGWLGLLLQEAFFNIAAFAEARQCALTLTITELIDFGRPFKGLLTRAQGIILRKQKNTAQQNQIVCQTKTGRHLRQQLTFGSNPKAILNFHCGDEDAGFIARMYAVNHCVLAGHATFALGIVTGANARYCHEQPGAGLIPVYRGAEIFRDRLDHPSCHIPADFSHYQQVAPLALYQAKEKLIYRFISNDLVFFYDNKQRFILNSANLLVLDEDFPISTRQLCQLLNSKPMNRLFRSLFATHKVLKADLESLPIHCGYFHCHDEFTEAGYLDYLGIKESSEGS